MIDELEGQLPNDISKEEARDAIESIVITNSVINGGKQVNSVADSAFAEFNVRMIPEYNNDKVRELFNKYINEANENGANLSQEIYLGLLPVVTTGKNKLLRIYRLLYWFINLLCKWILILVYHYKRDIKILLIIVSIYQK